MSEFTRRGFVTRSASAAAGMTAIGAIIAEQAQAAEKTKGHHESEPSGPIGTDPVVAFVHDPRKGEVSFMTGEHDVTIHDPKLAAQISRAAR